MVGLEALDPMPQRQRGGDQRETSLEARAKFRGDWSYAGGTFQSGPLLAAVTRRIGRPPVAPKLPPIGGALLAAAQHLSWPITPDVVEQLSAALRREPAKTPDLQLTN